MSLADETVDQRARGGLGMVPFDAAQHRFGHRPIDHLVAEIGQTAGGVGPQNLVQRLAIVEGEQPDDRPVGPGADSSLGSTQ